MLEHYISILDLLNKSYNLVNKSMIHKKKKFGGKLDDGV